jgi:hypothetical protein
MAIKNGPIKQKKMKIDLLGPEGNAFHLLAVARGLAKKLGHDPEKIFNEMTADDYEHLIKVFDSYFGNYVDLYR